MPLQMRSVFSSHVDNIGYDPENRELHVKYSKGQYAVYKDIPEDVAKNVLGSASIGEALHEHVKGKFEHEYL